MEVKIDAAKEGKKNAAQAHFLYSSKIIDKIATILDQIHAGQYQHSLIELLYWLAMQRVPFDWSQIENIKQYIFLKKSPPYSGVDEFVAFINALSVTDFDIPEIYKTCFIEANKNWRREEEVASYENRRQKAREDYLRDHEELPTAEHYLLYNFAITQQTRPERVYIIAGRLEGCGQATLATRLWDLPALKNNYPEHRQYALIRLAESCFSAARCLLEYCCENDEFYKHYWQYMPRIFNRLIKQSNVIMTYEREDTLIRAAESTLDRIPQIKTILRCTYPTTYRNADAIGAGFLAALELNFPEENFNPEASLNMYGKNRLKVEYEDRLIQMLNYFQTKTGQQLRARAQQCCTQVFSHDFRLLLLKLEEHVPQLQYHHPEICQAVGTMAMDANLLRIANEYFAFASTRLNISDSLFKLAKVAEEQRSRGATDLLDNEIKQTYHLSLDGGHYAAAMRLAEIYKATMSPRDENRSKKIYGVLFRGFDAAYNMKDSVGCAAILQSINVSRAAQILPTDAQKLEILHFEKLYQNLTQDQQLFHDVLKQHRNESGGIFKIGDLARSRRGNYRRLLASADGNPQNPFANACMLFIYPDSDKSRRLNCISNESSFDTMLNYYLWWFRKKYSANLTQRSFTEIASDVIVKYFEFIISTQPYQCEKQLQAKFFLALIRYDRITLIECYHHSTPLFYHIRQSIGKWDRQSDEQDQLLSDVEKQCTAEMDTIVLLLLSFMEASLALDSMKAKELALKIQPLIANFTLLDDVNQRGEAHKRLWVYANNNYNLLAIAYYINLRHTPRETFESFVDLMKRSLNWPKLEHYYSKHCLTSYNKSDGNNRCAGLFESIKNLGLADTESQSNYFNFARIMLCVITEDGRRLKGIYKKDYKLTHSTLLKLLHIENSIGKPNWNFILHYMNKCKEKKQSRVLDSPEYQGPQETRLLTATHRRPSAPNNLQALEEVEAVEEVLQRPHVESYRAPTPNHLKRLPATLLDRSAAVQTPRSRSLSASTSAAPTTTQSSDDTSGLFSQRRRKALSPMPPSPSTSIEIEDEEETELNYSFSVPSKNSSHPLLIPRPPKFQ